MSLTLTERTGIHGHPTWQVCWEKQRDLPSAVQSGSTSPNSLSAQQSDGAHKSSEAYNGMQSCAQTSKCHVRGRASYDARFAVRRKLEKLRPNIAHELRVMRTQHAIPRSSE